MPIAIQEDLLSGSTLLEKLRHAQSLGVSGVEFRAENLTDKVPQIVDAMHATSVSVAAVNHGAAQGSLLAPEPAERERALANLRQSIMNAVDLGAVGVVFVPHFGAHVLPDLSPWMSPPELEAEMLHMHLRTLSDYAEALGVDLYIEPVNRAETDLLNRLEQAGRVSRRISHPRVKIAANLYQMALEEADVAVELEAHADCIGYVQLADDDHDLPGEGGMDFAAVAAALSAIGYTGWLTYECGSPSLSDPALYRDRLPASLAYLRETGIT